MSDIKYGNVEIPDDAFEPRNCKMRVVLMVDLDAVDALKKQAEIARIPFKEYVNTWLRFAAFGGLDG